ncbi:MAG: sulfotransferase [Sandaracinaceae bacterium]|nr:sulfotransferase [Sandaracinaceae bacterium]
MRETSTDYQHPFRPPPVAALNRLAAMLGRDDGRLDAHAMVRGAEKATGLSDFGPEFDIRPLEKLCESVAAEAHLTPVGLAITRGRLTAILQNRLRAEALFTQHPEILRYEPKAPIIIAGLQRTGTTMLHRLLSADPKLRALAGYEVLDPVPPSERRTKLLGRDPRLLQAKLAERALAYLAPDFFAIHPVEAESPEEEVMLLDYTFLSTVPEATLRVPSFSSWLEDQDQGPAYRYLRRLLKLLAWKQEGRRFVLKTPHHLEWFDTLLEVFPDAKIVQTHRDPLQTTASFCSMVTHGRGVFSDQVDPLEVGRDWTNKVVRMITRATEARERHDASHFLDVSYYDLMRDPLVQMERIYAFAGQPFDASTRAGIEASHESSPQHRYGKHVYKLESFGLEAEALNARFATYRERFQIPREDRR